MKLLPTRFSSRLSCRLSCRLLSGVSSEAAFPAWSRRLTITLAASALSPCIVVPQARNVYDPDCKTATRQVTLETAYIGGFQRCWGDGCVAMLAAAGFVTAASVVVSGSIAVVGNAVYWLERQGRCARVREGTPPASAAAPSASASASE